MYAHSCITCKKGDTVIVTLLRNLGRVPFNKNSGLKFRKFNVPNGTVHYGFTDLKPKPPGVWVMQEKEELYWGQHLCQIKGTKLVKVEFPNISVGPNWNGLFHLISNQNFRNFG